jgi:hypothetical protein
MQILLVLRTFFAADAVIGLLLRCWDDFRKKALLRGLARRALVLRLPSSQPAKKTEKVRPWWQKLSPPPPP